MALYGGEEDDSLNKLRYIRYNRQLAYSKAAAVDARRLPPTHSAAKFHSLRTYFQVQIWKRLESEKAMPLSAENWGWEVTDGMLLPVYTDAAVAPEHLLHVVTCRWKTGCGVSCGCRQHGLVCTAACGDCRGESCTNSVISDTAADSDDED